jgi:VIT1/CCC1 family predicted Fe2+/Mn2+ transporter
VLLAALTTAVAGAFSMAGGAYVATASQAEIERTEQRRSAFLNRDASTAAAEEGGALSSAVVVGVSYLAGAFVPVLPLALGAKSVLASAIVGGAMATGVSFVLAFLSGMEVRRRVLTNLAIVAAAVAVTYVSGLVLSAAFGIAG